MYIKSARITNIRSIEDFEINFEEPAGWHVLIGDNGSGKSTIIRSLALALIGPKEAQALWEDWRNWLSTDENSGKISLEIIASEVDEKPTTNSQKLNSIILNLLTFIRDVSKDLVTLKGSGDTDFGNSPFQNNWSDCNGWFSVAYGPYRRFTGGDTDLDIIYTNRPKLGAHLSALNEAAALTEITKWLMKLDYQETEEIQSEFKRLKVEEKIGAFINGDKEKMSTVLTFLELEDKHPKLSFLTTGLVKAILDKETFESIDVFNFSITQSIKRFVNSSELLPNNYKFEKISSGGVFFKDGNGNLVTINQLSDGYRSILSLTLELVRQLIRVYGEAVVFENIRKDDMRITLPA